MPVARPRPSTARRPGLLAALFVAAAPAPAYAQAHRDVQLIVQSGALITGVIDFDQPGNPVTPGVRVFAATFGEVDNGTDDPGFSATAQPALAGRQIAFDILDALRVWQGGTFSTIAAERLNVSLGVNVRTTPLVADQLVSGFSFVVASGAGSFHQHMNYFLGPPFAQGVYLLKLQVRCVSCGVSPTAPFYVVFNQDQPGSTHQAAIDYVQNVLLAPPVCLGDANADRAVNFTDITAVLTAFGSTGPTSPGIPGDANRDGVVNFSDITSVLSNWGQACS